MNFFPKKGFSFKLIVWSFFIFQPAYSQEVDSSGFDANQQPQEFYEDEEEEPSKEIKKKAETVILRNFDREQMNRLRQNPNFDYSREKIQKNPNWIQRLKKWLNDLFFQSINTKGKRAVWEWMLYLFCIVMGVFVVMKLLGADISTLFYSKRKYQMSEGNGEDIQIDDPQLDKFIQEAIQNQQYNLAVRYCYLKMLRQLQQKDWIRWEKEKTNRSYANEIKKESLKTSFLQLTSVFEYVFYGNFILDRKGFEEIQGSFLGFEKELAQH